MGNLFQIRAVTIPLLVSIPHTGTDVPEPIFERLTAQAKKLPDTDWDLDRLYDLPVLRDCSLIQAKLSRYVIDLNRPASNASLYPGQNTTEICPVTTFSGEPIYQPGNEPDESEIASRISTYWQPYHSAIADELDRLKAFHGQVVLFDAHSIASEVPRLFPGRLSDFNFGTNQGRSCSASFQSMVNQFSADQLPEYSSIVNGRFIGGYITRNYGRPVENVDALQLELSQATYMNETSGELNNEAAAIVQKSLSLLLERILNWIQQK